MNQFCTISVILPWMVASLPAAEPPLRGQAARSLRRAVEFFRKEVAVEGGYLWRYSDDLKLREGEGKQTDKVAWVQPPGTPSIGLAFLTAYEATGDPYYLEAARETAGCLVKGQLRSGGWTYRIDFDPALRKQLAYRVDPPSKKARNVTTLDDNTTQEALRLLMRLDRTLQFKDQAIHEAAEFALNALLKAQYPIGAWPQGYGEFPDPAKYPVKKASYHPDSWPRQSQYKNYWEHYTLNDGTLADMIDVMFLAGSIYGEEKYRLSALKGGDFILLAQMPEPQPAWAQQYDADMHPAWARKFEPPSVTGGESQRIIRTLMQIYRQTGDKKYLEPIPRALDYLKKSMLPDGRLARFYELKTNRPLYFTKDYQLTHDDRDLPTHYGFKVASSLDAISAEYENLKKRDPASLKKLDQPARPELNDGLISQVKTVVAALDDRGRWVEEGSLRFHGAAGMNIRIIDCQTFIRNVGILSRYLAATK